MAKLYFIYAPMSSGKSTMLLTKAHSFEERNIPFLCLKPSIDDRDGKDVIKSRIGISRECVTIEKIDNLYNLYQKHAEICELHLIDTPKWLLIDESQFLSKEQVDQLARLVDEQDVNVLCYGLRTDFTSRFFEGSQRLMEIADTIEELKSTCGCGRKAIVNARFHDGELVVDGEQIMIGGDEAYLPLCRRCFQLLKKKN